MANRQSTVQYRQCPVVDEHQEIELQGLLQGHTDMYAEQNHFFCTPCDPELQRQYQETAMTAVHFTPSGGVVGELSKRVLAGDLSYNGSQHVDPYTKDLVICDRTHLPTKVLETVPFINTQGDVVTGCTYDLDTGDVVAIGNGDYHKSVRKTNADGSKRKLGYARVLTTNWWYSTLMITLVKASLQVMGKNANIIFTFSLLSQGINSPISLRDRQMICAIILALDIYQVFVFYKLAMREFKQKSNVEKSGDLVTSTAVASKYAPFWALVLFHFLEIDSLVKDVVKYLHPFKDRQPFAAFKADGHRAMILGFRDVHAFHASHLPRPFCTLLSQIVIESMCLIFKILCGIATQNYSFLVMAVPGVCILYYKVFECFKRDRHREHYWRHLRQEHLNGSPEEQKSVETARKNTFADMSWEQETLGEKFWIQIKLAGTFILLLMFFSIICTTDKKFLHALADVAKNAGKELHKGKDFVQSLRGKSSD